MMLVLFSLLGMSVEASGTVWLDAYELQDGTVTLPGAATYSVWLWVSEGSAAQVTLGGEAFQTPENTSSKGSFRWVKAGEAELPAGPVEMALEGSIASVALSSDAAFHPEKAQPCMRVFDQPEVPLDGRYNLPRDTDATFCMTSFASREDWEACAAALRRTILVSSALWPMPERTPLNAHIEPAAEHDDYLIEKVYFESRPGVLVTGNLYRPKGEGPFPGVACPHGHWNAGRLAHEPLGSVPARCITLARMGMVAFSYDMVGYVDSLQFPKHGWEDPVHKLYGLHPFAFQLWNSLRVVDFLASLPYVDAGNLACTGASGGGTQTFALQAIEPRIKVSAPVNMISHSMQGGCLCENAPILRMRASNMEIAALMAPRPMLMVSTAGDWTRLTPRVEFPAIRGVYAFYGAADRVENKHFDYPHNYNEDSRTAMYRFFGKWVLNQGARYETFTEAPCEIDPDETLRVFPDGQLPDGFGTLDAFMPSVMEATRAKCAAMLPPNPEAREAFRSGYGAALFDLLGVTVPEPAHVGARRLGQGDAADCSFERLLVWRPDCNQAIPAVLYKPLGALTGAVLAVHSQGKAALADLLAGGPGALVRAQLAEGKAVLCIDTFLTGEYQHPRTGSSRKTYKFPDTFQPTDTAFRIHDIVTAAVFLRAETGLPVAVTGLGDAGVWALFAAAIEPAIAGVVADTAGFDPSSDAQWVEKHYLPCIRSVGDLNTVAAMLAPRPVELIHCADPGLWGDFQRAYVNAAGPDGVLTTADEAGTTAASE